MTTQLLLLAAALITQSPSQPFTSDAGRFRATFPGSPKEQVVKVPAPPVGEIETHILVVEKGGLIYAVAYNDLPKVVVDADPKATLEGGVQGAVKKIEGGKLIAERDITVDGNPGKEFEASMAGPKGVAGVYRSRIVMAKPRLYQVIHAGPKDAVMSDAGAAFLKSFQVVK